MNKFDKIYNKIIKEAIGDVSKETSKTKKTITDSDGGVTEIEEGKKYTVMYFYRPRPRTEEEKEEGIRPPDPNKGHVLRGLYLNKPTDDYIGHDADIKKYFSEKVLEMHRIYFDNCDPDNYSKRDEKDIFLIDTDEEFEKIIGPEGKDSESNDRYPAPKYPGDSLPGEPEDGFVEDK